MRKPLILTATLSAALALALPGIASAAPTLFWSVLIGDGIVGAEIASDGTAQNTPQPFFVAPSAPVDGPFGTTLDPSTGRVFWVNNGDNKVYAGDINDPSQPPTLVAGSGVSGPQSLAFNPANDSVYWVNAGTDEIAFAKADGSSASPTQLYDLTGEDPQGLAIDPANNKIYWSKADLATGNRIAYANLDGSGSAGTVSLTAPCNLSRADALAIDPKGNRIYAYGQVGGTTSGIAIASIDGSSCQFETSLDAFGGFARDAEHLFVADTFAAGIQVWPIAEFPSATPSQFTSDGTGTFGLFPAVLDTPTGTATVSPATAEVGAELTCGATWDVGTPGMQWYRAPQTKSISWSKDGQPISGATSATFKPDSAGEYACNATGTNYAGSKTVSASATVTAPPTPPGPTPTPSNVFTVRTPLLVGTGIRTIVRVPGAGVIRQAGTFRKGGKVRQACASGAVAVSTAGVYRLRCRLTDAVRAQRRKGAVRVRLVTTYKPTGGTARAVVRTVVLRSLKPRFTG